MLKRTSGISYSLLVAGIASVSTLAACSGSDAKSGDEARTARTWSCSNVEVPAGEAVRCTSSALTSGPGADNEVVTNEVVTYACEPGSVNPDCPPDNVGVDVETVDGGDSDAGQNDSPTEVEECSYVDDLTYCEGDGGTDGGAEGGDAGDSDGGAIGTGNGNGNGQGKDKDKGKDGSSADGGSSGGDGGKGKGKGRHYKCEKNDDGSASCTSTPDCAPGTHPSECGACVDDGADCDCVPPVEGGCWVTGGGYIVGPSIVPAGPADGNDNFGGNAKPMKDGTVKGQWNHVDHGTGNHAHGSAEYIYCRKIDGAGPGQPGGKKGLTSNQVYFGGPARWDAGSGWKDGYWFDVVAVDRGEPGSKPSAKNGGTPDAYHFTLRVMDDPAKQVSGAIVYETKESLSGGNVQIHPPNGGHPATQSALPSWVTLEE